MTRVGLWLTWTFILLGATYLVLAGGGGVFAQFTLPVRAVSILTLPIMILVWALVAMRNPFWLPRSAIAPALFLCVAAIAVGQTFSRQPHLGLESVVYATCLLGGYLLLQRVLSHPFLAPRLMAWIVILGFALSVLYVVAVFTHWMAFWDEIGRIATPPLRPAAEGLAYGHPSPIATATVLCWFVAAAHLGFAGGRQRIVLVGLSVLVLIVVFLTGSRAAWVGLAMSGIIVVPLWLGLSDGWRNVRSFWRNRLARGTVVGIILPVTIVAAITFLPAIASRLSEPASETRSAFYLAATRMFLDRPLTGQGPGLWAVERAQFTNPTEADYYVPHAHNIYLQTAAELGLVGLAAGCVLAVSLALLIARGIRSSGAATQRVGWATAGATIYLAGHQLFDFYPSVPAIGFLFAVLIARLDGLVSSEAISRPLPVFSIGQRRKTAGLILLGFVCCVGAGFALNRAATAIATQQAAFAADNGEWAEALAVSRDALAREPDMPPYLFTYALAAAHRGDLVGARDAMLRSAQIDGLPVAWLNVAKLELDLGNAAASRAALGEAMRLGYQSPQVAMGAATVFLELGDRQRAVSAVADALAVAYGLASDPYWQSTAELQALRDDAIPIALSRAPAQNAYLLALEAGSIDDAGRRVEGLTGPARDVGRLIVPAWAGDAGAFEKLHDLALSDPLNDEVVAQCRRVAARSREADWQHPVTYECEGAGKPNAVIVVRVSPSPRFAANLPGPGISWHFMHVYGRLTPSDWLVPGLPNLQGSIV